MLFSKRNVHCSQSPIFSWDDRWDIARLTVKAAILFSNVPKGRASGIMIALGGGGRFLPNRLRPLSSFDTHARWPPIWTILRKNRGLWTVKSHYRSYLGSWNSLLAPSVTCVVIFRVSRFSLNGLRRKTRDCLLSIDVVTKSASSLVLSVIDSI